MAKQAYVTIDESWIMATPFGYVLADRGVPFEHLPLGYRTCAHRFGMCVASCSQCRTEAALNASGRWALPVATITADGQVVAMRSSRLPISWEAAIFQSFHVPVHLYRWSWAEHRLGWNPFTDETCFVLDRPYRHDRAERQLALLAE